MSSDFDWHGDKDAELIILSYQPPTAVYSTKGGGICVRQKADEQEEYDPQVLLTPQGALAVAWALIEEAHLVGLPSPSLSLMTESEHWPPMYRRMSEADLRDPPNKAPTREPAASPPGPLLDEMEGRPPANDAKNKGAA